MKRFLVVGLAVLAIASFSPQTHANPPAKKPAPAAVNHANTKAPVHNTAIHNQFKPGPGHGGPGGHPIHANGPNRNPRMGNARVAHDEQLRRAQAERHDRAIRDERLHAQERARLHDDRLARERDARLHHYHGDGDASSDATADDSSADSAADSSGDSSGDATDPKAAALGAILNLLQKK